MKARPPIAPTILWAGVVALAVIGTAAAVSRMLVLFHVTPDIAPPGAPAGFDAAFGAYPATTFVHVLLGAIVMVLAPLQFIPRLRAQHPWLHRWTGRLLVAVGAVVGATALRMSALMAIGGATERAATTLFGLLFLVALGMGFVQARRRRMSRHREWMLRAFALAFAVATVRPIVALFFALSSLSPREFFGVAFWMGFTLHVVAAEAWIRRTRRAPAAVEPRLTPESMGVRPARERA
jgi:hypothetical protein